MIEILDIDGNIFHKVDSPTARDAVEKLVDDRSSLARADLRGLDLSGLDLSYACMNKANLAGSNLTGTCLRFAKLTDANLTGVNLTRAELNRTSLARACLHAVEMNGAQCQSAVLRHADCASAYLNYANLEYADLTGANLSVTGLAGANFWGARLEGVKINWSSHALLAEVLRQAAGDDVPRRMAAGLIAQSLNWCWNDFLHLHLSDPEVRNWALDTLAAYAEGDSRAPVLFDKILQVRREKAILADKEKERLSANP